MHVEWQIFLSKSSDKGQEKNTLGRLKRCGGSRTLLSVRDLTLTTFEWIAHDTQYCIFT